MTLSTRTFEGFSLSRALILDGSTAASAAPISAADEDGELYGVRNASLAANTGNFDNTGNDAVLSSWYWLENATLTVEAGYIPFLTIALMTGDTITSTGSAPNDNYSLPLWSEASVNVAPRPVLISMPSKDSDGVIRVMDFVLYKVQFSPISFTGPQYKTGLAVSYSGKALVSAKDEVGATLTDGRAVGRMINRPS